MMIQSLRSLAALVAVAGLATLGTATPASATIDVTYSTNGEFSNAQTGVTISADLRTITVDATTGTGDATLTFTPLPSTSVAVPPPEVTFGQFAATSTLSSGGATSPTDQFLANFTLTITQTDPTPGGNVSFSSDVSGRIFRTSGGTNGGRFVLLFDDIGPLSIGPSVSGITVLYEIAEADGGITGQAFIPVNQTVSLEGRISAVPEPSTVMTALACLPILGIGTLVRRVRKRR